MAEKKSMSLLVAKAVARVKEQSTFAGRWGAGEHSALLRYMAVDAVTQAKSMVGKPLLGKDGKTPIMEADGKTPRLWTIEQGVNSILRDAFLADPELTYASNFDKLLKKCGEIAESSDYE